MSKIITGICFLIMFNLNAFAQVTAPKDFLGYEIGEKFTFSHTVEAYFKQLAAESDQVQMEYYGESYEGKPLYVIYVSSPANIARLDAIKTSNRSKTGLSAGPQLADQPAIIWLSYNIHGNEAVSTETAMLTAFELITKPEYNAWLNNTVAIIDPCLNPDGHTRYVQFYKERRGAKPNASPYTREHLEPWPGGRPNHYLFDLNRDWAWQTQVESQHRGQILNAWMPHVHVDFHEMGVNSPYFFAPAAEPIHESITPWQRDFHNKVGRHLGKEFDERNWLYFAGEVFDLFYPSYGDTYPTFNGSIGMTYEQGGSGRAGLAVTTAEGDTLTLRDRIDHHHIAGLHTIELTHLQSKNLIKEFESYFKASRENPKSKYKTYVVKHQEKDKLESLITFLDKHDIRYGFGAVADKTLSGYSYRMDKSMNLTIAEYDLVIASAQPKSVLLNVLFEPQTMLPDSNTYDITGWALPYARGLDAYALETAISPAKSEMTKASQTSGARTPVAYAFRWKSVEDAQFLGRLLEAGLMPRFTSKEIKFEDITLEPGSMILTRNQQEKKGESFDQTIREIAKELDRELIMLESSFPVSGPSFGSSYVNRIEAPTVALLSGSGTSSGSVGEVWHFFDQELQYPIHLYESSVLNEALLQDIDVLILPSLYGGSAMSESLLGHIKSWVRQGGTLIALEGAVAYLSGKEDFNIAYKKEKEEEKKKEEPKTLETDNYAESNRKSLSDQNPGSILKVKLDTTHPLAYGYSDTYYSLKTNSRIYAPLDSGWNVGICQNSPVVSGFIGANLSGKMENFLALGTQDMGRGTVVYFCDNPIFRSFWDSGKLLLCNAVFLVNP